MRRKPTYKSSDDIPDIFYRYKFVDGGIEKVAVKKHIFKRSNLSPFCAFIYEQGKGTRNSVLARPYDIKFGVYDGKRNAVFLESDNGEIEAANIFDDYYESRIKECEVRVKGYILSRKALQEIIRKGGSNGGGV